MTNLKNEMVTWDAKWDVILQQPIVRLNLGSGDSNSTSYEILEPQAEWIDVDIQPFTNIDIVSSVNTLPNFPNACADEIMASHVLEHFFWIQSSGILAEWTRVLKPGGTMTIRVPDLGQLIELYNQKLWCIDEPGTSYNMLNCLYGQQENPYDCHFAGFTKNLLLKYLSNLKSYRSIVVSRSDRGHDFEMCCRAIKMGGVDPLFKQRWIEALLSGRYQLGTEFANANYLKHGESFSVLGVLCDISQISQWTKNGQAPYPFSELEYYGSYNVNHYIFPPDEVLDVVHLSDELCDLLIDKSKRFQDFKKLAQWMEINL